MFFEFKKIRNFLPLEFFFFCGSGSGLGFSEFESESGLADPDPTPPMWAGYLIQVVHARADEEGLQAAVLAQQDIRVRPVPKHAKIKPGEDPYWKVIITLLNIKQLKEAKLKQKPDTHVFGPPGSGSSSQRYISSSGSGSFPFLIKVLSGLK